MKVKLARVPEERKSINELYLNSIRMFGSGSRKGRRLWAEKVAALEKVLLSPIVKQLEENGEQSFIICGRQTAVVILKHSLTQISNRHRMMPLRRMSEWRTTLSMHYLFPVRRANRGSCRRSVRHALALSGLHIYVQGLLLLR